MKSGDEVWVAGEVLIDLIPTKDGVPTPIVGGGGANTAKALARLGIKTFFIDGISRDEYGALARKELEESGIDLKYSNVSDKPTATAIVMIAPDGGATYKFSLAGTATFDFNQSWLPKGEPRVLHVGTLATIIEPGATALFHWAKEIPAPKVFDPNVRPSVLEDKVRYREIVEQWFTISNVIKLSEDDLFWLYPAEKNIDDAIAIARSFLRNQTRLVVITRGVEGLIGVTHEQTISVPGVRTEVVDTVGAGDTVGAILVESIYNHGLDYLVTEGLQGVLSRAAKAAAITCSRPGAQPPTAAELLL